MDSLGNVNHAISISGYWIFDSNHEKERFLTQESLYVICYPSISDKQVATLQSVFYTVRYIWEWINLTNDKHENVGKMNIHKKITNNNEERYYI